MEADRRIRRSTSTSHTAHLDTYYLVPAVLGRDPSGARELVEISRRLVLGGSGSRCAVSIVTIGETVATLINKLDSEVISRAEYDEAASRLASYVREGKIEVCGWGSDATGFFQLVQRIHEEDSLLEPSDLLIAAAALLCAQCSHLYVAESRMVESKILLRLFREREKGIGEPSGRVQRRSDRKKRYGGAR